MAAAAGQKRFGVWRGWQDYSPLKRAAHSLRSLRVLSRDYVGARVERSPCGRLFEFLKSERRGKLAAVVFLGGGAAGRIRTCDPWFRRPVLYPAELQPLISRGDRETRARRAPIVRVL